MLEAKLKAKLEVKLEQKLEHGHCYCEAAAVVDDGTLCSLVEGSLMETSFWACVE